MSVYDKLSELGITLPPVAVPAAAYVPFVQTGKLVFLSGHIAKKDGKAWVGQLGKTMATEEGKAPYISYRTALSNGQAPPVSLIGLHCPADRPALSLR